MCSKNIEAILRGIKHDSAGASCSLSYAPTPDDNSKNTWKSIPELGFEFPGGARAGSLEECFEITHALWIIANVPALLDVLQMTEAQMRALSCKIRSGAKATASRRPCQGEPPCESEPSAAKRRAGPGDTGMGKRRPC